MLTKLPEQDLIALGARVRAPYLREQAGYTLAIAATEGAPLAANLDDGYLAETSQCLTQMEAAMNDKTVAAAEATLATSAQGAALRNAKLWRRKVAARGARARRKGENLPDGLTVVTRASSVADISQQLAQMLALYAEHVPALGKGAQALYDEGNQIASVLKAANTDHDLKYLDALPKSVRAFYALKGTLYTALKVINGAGHELHADHPILAASYNLKILHRHGHALAAPAADASPSAAPPAGAQPVAKPAAEPAK